MDNRRNILESALKLFYEKGYDAIGVQEIADAAGVSKPTLYHYYGSKYGLLEAVAADGFVPMRDGIAAAAVYEQDLPANLECITRFYFDYCSGHEAYFKLMMAMTYSAEGSDTYRVIRPCMEEITAILTDLFTKAGHIIGNMRGRQKQYSIGFYGFLNSYMLYWFTGRPENRPRLGAELVHEVVHQFLYGIYV